MAVVGRPSVVTVEVIRKLEEAFALGCTDLEACLYANISKTALYEYQKDNSQFAERKEKLKQAPILLARRTIINSLNNPQSAQWYLERKKKDEFSIRVENTGKDGQPIVPTLIQIIKPDVVENPDIQTESETIPSVGISDGQSND